MQTPHPAIWIRPADTVAEPGCGACASAEPAGAPDGRLALSGDMRLITQVLDALRQVREPQGGRDIVESGRVQGLELTDGEATLTLRMGQGLCGDAHMLAEMAFEALRHALPDTDLYLQHDRPMGCAARTTADPVG